MNWERCRGCTEMVSVDRSTKIPLCENCAPAFAEEHYRRQLDELLNSPLDIDRPVEEEDLDIERMLGMKVRKPPEFVTGNPEWFLSGGLPSLGKGYS